MPLLISPTLTIVGEIRPVARRRGATVRLA